MDPIIELRQLAADTIQQGEVWLFAASTKASPQGRIAHIYTLSIFEQFRAALALFDLNAGAHSPSQIRCMLEYVVDLINVLNDPAYVEQLKAENAQSDHKVAHQYEAALSGEEIEEPMAGELSALLDEVDARERQRAQARAEKIKQTRQPELPWMYSFLCGLTHPNITALMLRHAGPDGTLAYCRPPVPEVHGMLLSMAINLLSLTIRKLPAFTDCEPSEVADFLNRVDSDNIRILQY